MISKDNIQCHKVGYVETKKKPVYEVERVGWWPDPLIPLKGFDAKTLDVAGNLVQPIWITVDVPENALAGDYEGTITIKPSNSYPIDIKVFLHVWDFTLPSETHLKSVVWVWKNLLIKYYGDISWEFEKKFYDILLEHRFSPQPRGDYCIGSFIDACLERDGSFSFNFSQIDDYLSHCYKKGLNAFTPSFLNVSKIPASYHAPIFDKNLSKKRELYDEEVETFFLAYFKAVYRHLKQEGWMDKITVYAHVWDEPHRKTEHQAAEVFRKVKEAVPEAKILTTDYTRYFLTSEVAKNTGIWCPLFRVYDEDKASKFRKAGREVWAYWADCTRSPYPNILLDYPGIDCRIIPWIYWKHNIPGMLNWAGNFWGWGEGQNYEKDPKKRWPNKPWDPVYAHSRPIRHTAVGWFYPGKNGPLSSIRLEILRDGMEDYEYFYLLREKFNRLKKLRGDKYKTLVKETEQLLKIDDNVFESMSSYTKNPQEIYKFRERVALQIEKIKEIWLFCTLIQ